MRFGARQGRSCLIGEGCYLDVQDASAGEFSEHPMEVLEHWSSFREWARSQVLAEGLPYQDRNLTCPVPAPGQIFAIGLNYRDHAVESSMEIPDNPMVFTKYPSSLTVSHGVPMGPWAHLCPFAHICNIGCKNLHTKYILNQ